MTDEAGYTLCSNNAEDFTCIKNSEDNLIIVDYDGEVIGEKLIIPAEINGVKVQTINKLNPVQGVKIVVISSGIDEINNSFSEWHDLESIVIEDGLKKISAGFNYGTQVRNVILPNSVEEIGNYFFKSYDLSNGVELPSNMTTLNKCLAQTNLKNFIIPGHIKLVESGAFENCTDLQVVYISEGVETIQSDAFLDCSSLQAVSVPASLKNISRGAIPEDILWVVVAGSEAEAYAVKNNIKFGYQ